jgi:hypothetical protein
MLTPSNAKGAATPDQLGNYDPRLNVVDATQQYQAGKQDNSVNSPKRRKVQPGNAPQITYEMVCEWLRYNPKSGKFYWRKSGPGRVKGKRAGTIASGYQQVQLGYRFIRGGRLAWLMQTGEMPPADKFVDHIDGNPSNDAWGNLRLVTPAQNNRNRNPVSSNASGRLGVYLQQNGRFNAAIWHEGEKHGLGTFECVEDATAARCEAEKHFFGDFRRQVAKHAGEAS